MRQHAQPFGTELLHGGKMTVRYERNPPLEFPEEYVIGEI